MSLKMQAQKCCFLIKLHIFSHLKMRLVASYLAFNFQKQLHYSSQATCSHQFALTLSTQRQKSLSISSTSATTKAAAA